MRLAPTLTAAGVAAAAVAGHAISSSGVAAGQTAQTPLTFEVFSKDRTERGVDLDLGRRGLSAGDRTMARGPLFDPANTSRRVGSYTAELITFAPRRLLTQARVTVVLDGGQVTVDGSLPFRRVLRPQGAALPVTGGTGRYAQARGTATLRARRIGGDEGFAFTLELTTD